MLVVMADDGIAFDGATPDHAPLGGAEGAFVALAEGFAALGHRVEVRNRCVAPLQRNGVGWAPLAQGMPEEAGLYIANRGNRLIGLVRRAERRIFWIHNPGRYLKKPRYIAALLRHWPVIVTTGRYHAASVPWWMPGGRADIPYGLPEVFRRARPERAPPPPRAIFTSNPLRGLAWLLALWEREIFPALPQAELHLYCGAEVYGGAKAAEISAVLARADALVDKGVRRHAPLPRDKLIEVLEASRVMLYRGDVGETFCLAVAEAQALGVPAVVQPLGAVGERVIDGETGVVAPDEASFVRAALALLGDDALWRRQHGAALQRQKGASWQDVAGRFLALAS